MLFSHKSTLMIVSMVGHRKGKKKQPWKIKKTFFLLWKIFFPKLIPKIASIGLHKKSHEKIKPRKLKKNSLKCYFLIKLY